MTLRIKNQKFYRTYELADMLPLSEQSIRNYIRAGKIPSIKIGLFWYTSETNLNLFLTGKVA
jgi:hypothetical protein